MKSSANKSSNNIENNKENVNENSLVPRNNNLDGESDKNNNFYAEMPKPNFHDGNDIQ